MFSAEHWCESVRDWVCWSVPVRSPDGRRLGVLDLSGRWDTATPVAEHVVAALGRLVQDHLPADALRADLPELELHLLGHLDATLGGLPLALSPRQAELLAALAIEGPATLDELRERVYGDHPVSAATVKAELSHLRRLLGGGIESRPYRLTMPIRVDAIEIRHLLRQGDLRGATDAYAGQLLPASEAPFAIDHRHIVDVALRRSLLESGDATDLLRFASIHRYDEAILERALALTGATDQRRHEARARLDIARGR
ncbi:MAG: helix-turn-helix domain-containing protein [Acidimicrobiales bacterium]